MSIDTADINVITTQPRWESPHSLQTLTAQEPDPSAAGDVEEEKKKMREQAAAQQNNQSDGCCICCAEPNDDRVEGCLDICCWYLWCSGHHHDHTDNACCDCGDCDCDCGDCDCDCGDCDCGDCDCDCF